MLPYEQLYDSLRSLLREFGRPRKSDHPEYPFYYLKNDDVWELENVEVAQPRAGKPGQPPHSELIRVGALGGMPPRIYTALQDDPNLCREVVTSLLDGHFPSTMHEDILEAVGLDMESHSHAQSTRNPEFRRHVLLAYSNRCAVCSFDARVGDCLVGIEAAHIKWVRARGPCAVENGLALCSLHHKLFDRGAFSLSLKNVVEVSKHVSGNEATESLLTRFHGRSISLPADPEERPLHEFVEWHRREVFREPARYSAA
jgi:putative restriction endonuclease